MKLNLPINALHAQRIAGAVQALELTSALNVLRASLKVLLAVQLDGVKGARILIALNAALVVCARIAKLDFSLKMTTNVKHAQ